MVKRVGVITIYTEPNYGSVLQAYATQVLLEHLGHKCQIIRYKYPNEWNYKQGYPRASVLRLFVRRLGLKYRHRKINHLKQFIKKHFHLTQQFESLKALEQYDWAKYFDVIATGSDQVWNYRYLYGDSAFMLSFLPQSMKRISIASSFACKEITSQYLDKYYTYLSRYNAFSVRELFGKEILENQLKLSSHVKVMLDPTLLLSCDQWLSIIPEKPMKRLGGKPFILLYGLYYAFEPRLYIFDVLKFFQKKLQCQIVALEGYMKPEQCGGLQMVDCSDATLYEFMYLFHHARLVVTSSFHGTAFGLNFARPIISIVPNNGIDDRLSSLLRMVGAESCCVEVGNDVSSIQPDYDFAYTFAQLQKEREECILWIKNNL